jgi:DUF4097 and DUF4098 domain-containing protein YvlB
MRGMKCTIAGIALLAGVTSAACVVSVDSQAQILREDKRFTITGTPDVRLITFDGSIEIRAWDRREVLVEVEKRGPTREAVEALDVITSQNGNRIELEVKRPRGETFSGIHFHRSAHAKLIVSVPRTANLNARTGDGAIRVDGITGRLQLRTGDGSIRAVGVSGELSFNTGDGSVTVDGAEGRLDVETGDGGVEVTGKLAAVKLHTGDGSIVYRADSGTAMSDDWEITTGDGSIALYLPAAFGAELDAHTGDGTIRNDLDVEAAAGTTTSRRTVRGRIGSGGRLLRVRTGDGSIRLRAR